VSELTRREAIAAAALGPLAAAAPALAAADDLMKQQEKAGVAAAVAGEQATMVAFEAIANSGLLNPLATATMRLLLVHAKDHSDQLALDFEQELGDRPPLAPKRIQISGLLGLRTATQALTLALKLQERAIAAHLTAVRVTHDAVLLKDIAGMIGSDGQHAVVLRQLLHRDPVPSPFERGGA
jgi:hypothetical protein